MQWKQKLVFLSSTLISVVTGFLILKHFHHELHWPANRFGGTPVAIALIPVCLLPYTISCFYFNRWLHPIAFPRLRAALLRPVYEPPARPRKRARTIVLSALTGTLTGAIIILHFFRQPDGRSESALPALLLIPICLASFNLCAYSVNQWLRTRDGNRPGHTT